MTRASTPTTSMVTRMSGDTERMLPKRRASRLTVPARGGRRPRRTIPSANEEAKKTPVAASLPTRARRRRAAMARATATVKGSAAQIALSEEAPARRPIARPPKVAWASPSERSESPRCTTKTPRRAPTAPRSAPMRRARRMNPWARGSARSSITLPRRGRGPRGRVR